MLVIASFLQPRCLPRGRDLSRWRGRQSEGPVSPAPPSAVVPLGHKICTNPSRAHRCGWATHKPPIAHAPDGCATSATHPTHAHNGACALNRRPTGRVTLPRRRGHNCPRCETHTSWSPLPAARPGGRPLIMAGRVCAQGAMSASPERGPPKRLWRKAAVASCSAPANTLQGPRRASGTVARWPPTKRAHMGTCPIDSRCKDLVEGPTERQAQEGPAALWPWHAPGRATHKHAMNGGLRWQSKHR